MSYEARRVIATDHPALAGHFPGDPIVPGALILDEVLRAAEQWRGQLRLKSVLSVKFTCPLRPGNTFSINLHDEDRAHIVFECWHDGIRLASGRLLVEDGGHPL